MLKNAGPVGEHNAGSVEYHISRRCKSNDEYISPLPQPATLTDWYNEHNNLITYMY